jgi:hypothetical protein
MPFDNPSVRSREGSMMVPPSTGEPFIWVLPQHEEEQEEPQFVIRRFSSTSNTLTVRRMLIRPVSILVFGVCVLQTWNQMKNASANKAAQQQTPCASMDWKETETASLWSNNLWSRNRNKEQLPPYPGGWGKQQHVPLSPPPAPPQDNPQLYGWEPSLYPDPLVDPVRCGVAYLPQPQPAITTTTTTTTPSSSEDASTDVASPPPPLPVPSETIETPPPLPTVPENEITAAQAAPNNNNNNNNSQNNNQESSLRLCDPDWVLGGMYLEEISLALSKFSTLYGDWTTVHANYWTRRLQLRSPSPSPRHLDGPSPEDIDPHFSMEAAASENGVGPPTSRKSTGPAIELAVATVRKVCDVVFVFVFEMMEGFAMDLQTLTKLRRLRTHRQSNATNTYIHLLYLFSSL